MSAGLSSEHGLRPASDPALPLACDEGPELGEESVEVLVELAVSVLGWATPGAVSEHPASTTPNAKIGRAAFIAELLVT